MASAEMLMVSPAFARLESCVSPPRESSANTMPNAPQMIEGYTMQSVDNEMIPMTMDQVSIRLECLSFGFGC